MPAEFSPAHNIRGWELESEYDDVRLVEGRTIRLNLILLNINFMSGDTFENVSFFLWAY